MFARVILAGALVLLATPAFAQSTTSSADVAGFRTFATWPDDTQVLDVGAAVVSLGGSSWRWAFGSGMGAPTLFVGAGVAPHLQVSASIERDASSYSDGTHRTSFGDSYVVGKIALVDVATHRVGLAVSPMLQILGNDALTYYRYYKSSDTGRVQWALPVHVQVPFARVRLSGSAGVFSVGSRFASVTLEASLTSRVVVNGTISESFSTETPLVASVSTSRHRADASGGLSIVLSPMASVFGSIGRTISHRDQNSMTFTANFGLALFLGRH